MTGAAAQATGAAGMGAAKTATARIVDGVFFSTPAALPRGRHELSREQIEEAHRERLMIAATELMAERGYLAVGVGEICARAAVSRGAFYTVFEDKLACVSAAYDRFIAVVIDRLATLDTAAPDFQTFASKVIETYLRTLQDDLTVARAFQVEMDALGKEARQRRRNALRGVATFIMSQREHLDVGAPRDVPLDAYIGAVYAVRQLASDALDEEVTPNLPALVPRTAAWISRMLSTAADADAATKPIS
jgi:AcrR family transcriptional regulator